MRVLRIAVLGLGPWLFPLTSPAQDTADKTQALQHAKDLYAEGLRAFRQNNEAQSRKLNEESLAIGRQFGDGPTIATALIGLSRIDLRHHDYTAVREKANEALAIRQRLGDSAGELAPVHLLAAAARMQGDSPTASKYYELTLGIYGKQGNKSGVAGELMNLGYVHLHEHDPEWALRLFKESVSIYRELQSKEGLAWNVGGLAAVAAERHDAGTAARLYGVVTVAMQNLGIVLDPDDQLDFDRYSGIVRKQLGAREFEAAAQAGHRMTVDEGLALGLQSR